MSATRGKAISHPEYASIVAKILNSAANFLRLNLLRNPRRETHPKKSVFCDLICGANDRFGPIAVMSQTRRDHCQVGGEPRRGPIADLCLLFGDETARVKPNIDNVLMRLTFWVKNTRRLAVAGI
jgi:hypothetical protein